MHFGTTPPTVMERSKTKIEDPLDYLPCSEIVVYQQGQVIYSPSHPPMGLHLVIDGKVKVSRTRPGGRSVILDIYRQDEFFGETALLFPQCTVEQAVAFGDLRLMRWSADQIRALAAGRPELTLGLTQLLVARSQDLVDRIESFSSEKVSQRLARTLVRFAERLGNNKNDGQFRMPPLTHELLAEYVGTSREIVTHNLNQFRREGFLDYSRAGMRLHRDALTSLLEA